MVSGVAREQDGQDEQDVQDEHDEQDRQDEQDVHDEHDGQDEQDGCRLRLCWLRFRWLSCTQLRAVLYIVFVVFVLSATPKSFCYFRDLRLQVRKSAVFFFAGGFGLLFEKKGMVTCDMQKKKGSVPCRLFSLENGFSFAV